MIREVFGLNEELAESWMSFIGGLFSEHYLRITGQFDFAWATPSVGEGNAPYLGVIFWADYHLHVGLDVPVPPEEFGLVQPEACVVAGRHHVEGCGCGGPDGSRLSIAQINKAAIRIAHPIDVVP